jgi:hypothetical protein
MRLAVKRAAEHLQSKPATKAIGLVAKPSLPDPPYQICEDGMSKLPCFAVTASLFLAKRQSNKQPPALTKIMVHFQYFARAISQNISVVF